MTNASPISIEFVSGDGACRGLLWLPSTAASDASTSERLPVVLLAHGLGGTQADGLAAYAERFAAAGLAAITFDYRTFGDSPGEPRNLLSVKRQREDWRSAIAFARRDTRFDSNRIAIWGTSFGGGHTLAIAAEDGELAAVVSQCPFTDGIASALRVDPRSSLKITARGIADVAAAITRRPPVRVPVAGPAGQAALMTAADALPGYNALLAEPGSPPVQVPARIGLTIPLERIGKGVLKKISAPTLICICQPDSVAPDGPTRKQVKAAGNPQIDARGYPFGHFDIYSGEGFERVASDQAAFLAEQLLAADRADVSAVR